MASYSICDLCFCVDDFEFSEVYIDEKDMTVTVCPECEAKLMDIPILIRG